jgi:hypothetical protein
MVRRSFIRQIWYANASGAAAFQFVALTSMLTKPRHSVDASMPNCAPLGAPIRQLVSRFIRIDSSKLSPQANFLTLAAKEENCLCLAVCECVLEARQGLTDCPNT